MYANPDMAKAMCYCTNYHKELEDKQPNHSRSPFPCPNIPPQHPNVPPSSQLKDIFDGQHYCHLCQEQVRVPSENEGEFKPMQHLYFEDE